MKTSNGTDSFHGVQIKVLDLSFVQMAENLITKSWGDGLRRFRMPKFSCERFGLKGLTNAKSAMELEMSHKKSPIGKPMIQRESHKILLRE
jgi:hypothetical protein